MSGRVVLAVDDQGRTVAVGPVFADDSVDALRREIDAYGWTVREVCEHLSKGGFGEVRRKGEPAV